jgi:hypothetical protein
MNKTKKKPLKVTLEEILQFLLDFCKISGWFLLDCGIWLKEKLLRRPYVGIHMYICTPSEKRFFFNNASAGGFASPYAIFKIYANPKANMDFEEDIANIINHEVLHQVCGKVEPKARCQLDNIHKSCYVHDQKTKLNLWHYVCAFIGKDKQGKPFIVWDE